MRASLLAAALLAALAATAHAADLGTLFFSPAQREAMDRLRRGEPEQALAQSAPGGHEITGFVRRSDGRGTVWIDGRPVRVADPRAARVFDPDAVRDYSRSAREVKVKPAR